MEIIKSSEEIGRIFHEGRRISTPEINLIIQKTAPQRDHTGRVAFIAGKKQGNAVWRNRAKRRMRALYHDLGNSLEAADILFVAKQRTNEANYGLMLEHVEEALRRVGIY